MSFSVGIIGLPNAGKSTLFKAITKKEIDIAAHPFTTIQPNVGIVAVPDERLKKIAQVIRPEKTTETFIEFIDIAGLVKGAHKGEGLGNQFLSHIRNCDAVVEVVRAFSAYAEGYGGPAVARPSASEGGENPEPRYQLWEPPNPKRDIETIKIELLMKDLETLEKLFSKLEKEAKIGNKKILKKLELFRKIKESLSQGKLISEINLTDEEKLDIKEYRLLTEKPILYLFNINKKSANSNSEFKHLTMNLKDEKDISELTESEIKELEMKSQLDQLILNCYNVLDLITFFTVTGEKEAKAWTLKKGFNTLLAAEKVHSDFKERFIRAEVIPWQKLAKASSWSKAKELGLIKTFGKEYIVQDGDIIEFKI